MFRFLIPFLVVLFTTCGFAEQKAKIDFNRDIRPILSDRCFHCHGQDTKNQKSEYRLDHREEAIKDLGGYFGIIPGDPDKSEFVNRILHQDHDEVMPPPKSKLSLNEKEKQLLIQWIKEGAKYDKHWSFKKIQKPTLPQVNLSHESWVKNEIDYFVAEKLEEKGLLAEIEADPYTLIRRVSLDLRGLPPNEKEVQEFIEDQSPNAYEKMVERFLNSPEYGERLALVWMDAARYADSGGYQNDIKRSQWPWRDWVIKAYQNNMPFDQFSIEQLAGDLIPKPSHSQRLATAFNRNHRINNEGGIIPAEFLVEYVADRVETTSTVWLGLTTGCARCHDHKYDPISQKEYFQMFAFFHNIPEKGRDGNIAPEPNMSVYLNSEDEQKHKQLIENIKRIKEEKEALSVTSRKLFRDWLTTNKESELNIKFPEAYHHFNFNAPTKKHLVENLGASSKPAEFYFETRRLKRVNIVKSKFHTGLQIGRSQKLKIKPLLQKQKFSSKDPFTISTWFKLLNAKVIAEPILSVFDDPKNKTGFEIKLIPYKKKYKVQFVLTENQEKNLKYLWQSNLSITGENFEHLTISHHNQSGEPQIILYLNGQLSSGQVLQNTLQDPFNIDATMELYSLGLEGGTFIVYDDFKFYNQKLNDIISLALFENSPDKLLFQSNQSKKIEKHLRNHYFTVINKDTKKIDQRIKKAVATEKKFSDKKLTKVSIMEEMKTPRKTYRLDRGLYDHPDKREELAATTFATLPSMQSKFPQNRLGFAKWLFQDDHPLTSRVAINRYWQMFFGRGLVKTVDDFGSQGTPPSHPKLLDWLSYTFMQNWDIKAIHKKILMSATYRQSSKTSLKKNSIDPKNILLSRGARFRMNGQTLRDQALAVSGLLNKKQGGPPVMPYQPKGLWEEVSAKGYKYVEAKDESLYRRSLYTFWRRTVPPPSMMNFDNSSRDVCSVNTSTTNTPLQALNLMNDPQFVEAARVFAQNILNYKQSSISKKIKHGLEKALSRPADPDTLNQLTQSYQKYLHHFKMDSEKAKQLIHIGASIPSKNIMPEELAAMTMIATTILNLDEVINKE